MILRFSLQTNKVGSRCEVDVAVDDEEWTEMSEQDRGEYAKEMFWDNVMPLLGEWDWQESDG